MKCIASHLPALKVVGIMEIMEAGITHLEGLTQLKSLNLGLTAVTDAGITHLTELLSLNLID